MPIETHAKMILDVQPNIQKPTGAGAGGAGKEALPEKTGASKEQLEALRGLANKLPGGKGSSLAELLPEAKPAVSKSFTDLFKGMFSDAKTQGIGKAFNSMIGGLGEKMGGSTGMGILGGEIAGGAGATAGAAAGPIGIAAVVALGAVKKVIDEIISLPDKFMAAAQKVAGYVQAANPAVVDRFNLAIKDTTAILGHGLTPLMETFTEVVRSIADGLASSDLAGSMKSLFGDLKVAFADLKPHISIIVRITADLIAVFLRLASVMNKVGRSMSPIGLLGSVGRKATQNLGIENASYGQAAGQASMSGAEEFSRRATIAAFSTGADPAKATADNTAKIASLLERWLPGGGPGRGLFDFGAVFQGG